jgi:ankyrin repeat protein
MRFYPKSDRSELVVSQTLTRYQKLLCYSRDETRQNLISLLISLLAECNIVAAEALLRATIGKSSDVEELISSMRYLIQIEEGYLLLQKIFSNHIAEIGSVLDSRGQTGLIRAACQGDTALLMLFLDHGARFNAKDHYQRTVMYYVSKYDRLAMASELLKRGADPTVVDQEEDTPLHWAAYHGRKEIASLLLEYGAQPAAHNNEGNTPLHCASHRGHEAAARLLIAKGADIHARNIYGCTPLHHASGSGHETIVQALLGSGAKTQDKDISGNTPLHCASLSGHESVTLLLLGKEARVNAKNKYQRTPLHHASIRGHLEVARRLLQYGADAREKDVQGSTPLYNALLGNHRDVAYLLLTQPNEIYFGIMNRGHFSQEVSDGSDRLVLEYYEEDIPLKYDPFSTEKRGVVARVFAVGLCHHDA